MKKLTAKKEWEIKFKEKIRPFHPRSADKNVKRIMKRIDSVKNGLVTRSKKHGVECTITIEELRQMMYDVYGTPCKYCGRILTIKNLVMDHIIPLSKNGPSTTGNLQIICKSSNGMKGSLDERSFLLLLEWLDTQSEEMKKDISVRLARGFH